MRAQHKLLNGRTLIEVEGRNQKELFKALASVQDVFEADSQCGCCESANIRYSSRTVDDNDYYELACRACGASLSFGQHKNGETLFPKRKDSQGNLLANNGWKKWEPSAMSKSGPRMVSR